MKPSLNQKVEALIDHQYAMNVAMQNPNEAPNPKRQKITGQRLKVNNYKTMLKRT